MANIICADVRALLDESTAVFWTSTNVINAVNEALLECEAEVRTLWGTASIVVSSEFVAIPDSTIMIPQRIIGTASGDTHPVEYFVTKQIDLERFWSGWRDAYEDDAQSKFFIRWDADSLRCWPVSTASTTYTVEGILWPTEIASESDSLNVTHELYHAIMYLAAAFLIDDSLPQAAEDYRKLAGDHISEYRTKQRQRGGHTLMSIAPATRAQRAQQGSIRIGRRYY